VNILIWHVHAAWMTAFVQGPHRYLVPVLPDRGPDGRGRARTYPWPDSVLELSPEDLRRQPVDLVVLQRPHEVELAARWLGRAPGRDIPAVYVEHNAPQGRIAEMRHPMAGRDDMLLVHVTHFNQLFWDAGGTPETVIEHGIVDPGDRYTGELDRAVVVINEARRRGRVTGTDLLGRLGAGMPIDLFGIDARSVANGVVRPVDDLPQARLHDEMARRRAYVHPIRWTSLGLSLLEAMHLGMPVVALATTEVVEAVPAEAGEISNDVDRLQAALGRLRRDPAEARERGRAAREAAVRRYSVARFQDDWERTLQEVVP
jgi:hypothetical protein